MKLEIKFPADLINKAYLQQSPDVKDLDLFIANLVDLYASFNRQETEEHQKINIRDFLRETWYRKTNLVNTSDRIDLAIYSGLTTSHNVSVIIEAKASEKPNEMMTREKPNTKAFHEIILYYLREFDNGNYEVKNLIVTNTHEWFVFDGVWFEKNIGRNSQLMKAYRALKTEGRDTTHFYDSVAKPWLENLETSIPCCWFDLREYNEIVQKANLSEQDKKKLIELYKFLSPQHLLKLSVANDSNSLNNEFYRELLHILGLEEIKEKGKKLIRRKASERRNEGSLLENTINLLKVQNSLESIKNLQDYGTDEEEQYFSVALELCITWLNRILFLKLLEGRLIAWNGGDSRFTFLNKDRIKDYDDLQELFFEVLARQESDRTSDIKGKFGAIPYLNSSLFEVSPLEKNALQISSLKHRLTIPLSATTVLKNDAGKRRSGESATLLYLFDFLDSYDFASEGKAQLKETPKTIINASVLGLIFEKINGYRDGSFYTPGYITMYMSREAIRRAVLQKFNERYGWECNDFVELHNALVRVPVTEANNLVNSLKICDPAVGSGHFLVSALNEIIAIKAELQILVDKDGKLLRDYSITVDNDELQVMDGNAPFVYTPGKQESQRVQETLFNEKAVVIENCLFGVDINPKSVAICRLRLWIELLKNSYYREGTHLETLPNIDINIKCGNSLISRFSLSDDSSGMAHYAPVDRKRLKDLTKRYKEKVWLYKLGEKGPSNKDILRREIEAIKEQWRTFSLPSDFYMKELDNVKNELAQAVFAFDEVGHQKREKLHQRAAELEEKIAARQQTVYVNAFEWRFEFPEVLDEEGSFIGFDVVIGNPPYIRAEELKDSREYLKSLYSVFTPAGDIFSYFYERSWQVLKNGGVFSFINNTFDKTTAGKALREFVATRFSLQKYIDLTAVVIFEEATTYPIIMLAIKETNNNSLSYLKVSPDTLANGIIFNDESAYITINNSALDPVGWNFGNNAETALLAKIVTNPNLRQQFGKCYYGIKTSLNEAFITEKSLGNYSELKPVFEGKDIKKWIAPVVDKWMIVFKNKSTSGRFGALAQQQAFEKVSEICPEVMTHLAPFADKGVKRYDKGEYWWELRNCAYYELFGQTKIIFPNLQNSNKFALDESGTYLNAPAVFLPTKETWLLGILNSKVVWHFLLSICVVRSGGYIEVKPQYFEQIPIPEISYEQKKELVLLVDQTLAVKKADAKANTADLEKCIDDLVYKLYGLNEDEIKIVEGTA